MGGVRLFHLAGFFFSRPFARNIFFFCVGGKLLPPNAPYICSSDFERSIHLFNVGSVVLNDYFVLCICFIPRPIERHESIVLKP